MLINRRRNMRGWNHWRWNLLMTTVIALLPRRLTRALMPVTVLMTRRLIGRRCHMWRYDHWRWHRQVAGIITRITLMLTVARGRLPIRTVLRSLVTIIPLGRIRNIRHMWRYDHLGRCLLHRSVIPRSWLRRIFNRCRSTLLGSRIDRNRDCRRYIYRRRTRSRCRLGRSLYRWRRCLGNLRYDP
jgi:hypothetical protein